jgi:hypothetical protein
MQADSNADGESDDVSAIRTAQFGLIRGASRA